MAIIFYIPGTLRQFTSGKGRVEIEGSPATVGEALSALWKLYPGIRDRVATEQGQVREHINIFVGDEAIRFADGLSTKVPADAEVLIVPAVSGG